MELFFTIKGNEKDEYELFNWGEEKMTGGL